MRFDIPAGWYDAVDGFDEGVTVSAGNVGRTITLPRPTPDQVEYLENIKTGSAYDPNRVVGAPHKIFNQLVALLRAPSNRF